MFPGQDIKRNYKCFDKILQQYKLFTMIILANFKHVNVILHICQHHIHSFAFNSILKVVFKLNNGTFQIKLCIWKQKLCKNRIDWLILQEYQKKSVYHVHEFLYSYLEWGSVIKWSMVISPVNILDTCSLI